MIFRFGGMNQSAAAEDVDRILKPPVSRCGAEGHRSGLVIIVAKLVQELDEVLRGVVVHVAVAALADLSP